MIRAMLILMTASRHLPVNDGIHDPSDVGPDDGILALPAQQVDCGERLADAHILCHHIKGQQGIRPVKRNKC
jgi:hypothetical protein